MPLRNAAEHCVVGSRPGVPRSNLGRFLAADAKRAALVLIKDIPYPGDRRWMLRHFNSEIAAHAVGRRRFAGDDCQPAYLCLFIQILRELLELTRRQTVK